MTSPTERMERHPDIMAMRMRYERLSESPTTQVTTGLTFLAGVYLAVSPWIVGFNLLPTITVNNLFTGLALVAVALGLGAGFDRFHGLAWVAPIIGIWTIISPWVVSGEVNTTGVVINNVIIGAVILLLGLAVTAVTYMRGRERLER